MFTSFTRTIRKLLGAPPQKWSVLLYKQPNQMQPLKVIAPFASRGAAEVYGATLSPADFPDIRYTVLPYENPRP